MKTETKNLIIRILKTNERRYGHKFRMVKKNTAEADQEAEWSMKVFETDNDGKIHDSLYSPEFVCNIPNIVMVSFYISIDRYGDDDYKDKPYYRFY